MESPVPLGPVIEDSVRAHLVADVPVASFLSGGLDSSLVTVLAKRSNPGIEAYTINFGRLTTGSNPCRTMSITPGR